jgi:1-pyrroline-5-carboxylate dehydrogenase
LYNVGFKNRKNSDKKKGERNMNSVVKVPRPSIEPVRSYAPGTPEKKVLKAQLKKMLGETLEFPLVIGGKEVKTGNLADCRCPHDHSHVLARYHKAGPEEIEMAVKEAKKAWKDWSEMDWVARARCF